MAKENKRYFRLVCAPEEIPLVEDLLKTQGYEFEPEVFSPWCRVLTKEPRPLGESLAAFFGLIYIQDRSSMLPPLLLDPPQGAKVLDMCASPGSKTGFLAQLVGRDGFVLGNEPSRDRLETLRQNMRRLNFFQVCTCTHPGEQLPLDPETFDHIQLDPPCSGWGTVDKNPNVMKLWSEEKTEPLVVLQKKLIGKAAELLVPGGRILYSTCTTNVHENEEQVEYAVNELGLELVPLEDPAGFVFETPLLGQKGVLRVDQEASDAQGFFMAAFTKRESAHDHDHDRESGTKKLPGKELSPEELSLPEGMDLRFDKLPAGRIFDFNGKAFFLPEAALDLPPKLRWQGYLLGKMSRKAFRPNPRLKNLMPAYAPGAGVSVEDPEEIKRLLTGMSMDAPGKKGGTGLYYKTLPLGWLTRKGSRLLWSDR